LAISSLTLVATDALRRLAARPPDVQTLNAALRTLAKWRAELLANTLASRSGTRVLTGPFQGMDYAVAAAEGSRSARLLGCYEASLAPVIEEIVTRAYPVVIDIGAAEGYYAVGLARRMPQTRVMARDASDKAMALCRALAQANGVEDRVEVGGLFTHADFAICLRQPTLILCDIEAAEIDLLDPSAAPGLLAADILVECHDCLRPGITDTLTRRFAASHQITRIDRTLAPQTLPPWMEELSDLDRLIALWEWRAGPTPWLWMRCR
jgi:hypothetical protein